jgi:hypothetical protein
MLSSSHTHHCEAVALPTIAPAFRETYMVTGILPEEGPAQVGPVALPAGRWHYAEDDDDLVAWATVDPMPGAGRAWLALSAAHAATGLIPVLLQPAPPDPELGGQPNFGFYHPVDVALLDQMSAEEVLAAHWTSEFEDPRAAAGRAPFGDRFPGLARAQSKPLPVTRLQHALSALPPAHLGLVSARRPADVPAIVGWSVFGIDFYNPDDDSPDQPFYPPGARSLQIGAVLRSWETRFGARLLRIGGDAILQLLVERPPPSAELALRVAAEQYAFADEVAGTDGTVISIAASLAGAPIWEFWWD